MPLRWPAGRIVCLIWTLLQGVTPGPEQDTIAALIPPAGPPMSPRPPTSHVTMSTNLPCHHVHRPPISPRPPTSCHRCLKPPPSSALSCRGSWWGGDDGAACFYLISGEAAQWRGRPMGAGARASLTALAHHRLFIRGSAHLPLPLYCWGLMRDGRYEPRPERRKKQLFGRALNIDDERRLVVGM